VVKLASGENTRERLIASGLYVFGEKSYHGAGLSEILAHAEVPKGSFYHYFKSKEDFAVAVIERNAADHVARTRESMHNRKISPMGRLYGHFDMMREHYRENGARRECLIAKLALEVSQLSETLRAAVKSAYDQWAVLLAQVIREAQAAGEIDQFYVPESLANVLINNWEGATIRMQIEETVRPLDDFFEVILEHGLHLKSASKKRSD
jgi:TetR/AcrR family transcriptional repressor of nem operon